MKSRKLLRRYLMSIKKGNSAIAAIWSPLYLRRTCGGPLEWNERKWTKKKEIQSNVCVYLPSLPKLELSFFNIFNTQVFLQLIIFILASKDPLDAMEVSWNKLVL